MSDPTPTPVTPIKPGWATTEHALSLIAIILTALFGAGVIPTSGPIGQIAVTAGIVLTALGYTVVRGNLKSAATLLLVGALSIGYVSTQAACTGPVPIPVSDLIDCTKTEGTADWATIVTKLEPDALSGNWAQLVVDVTAIAPTYALHIVECVGEELIQQYVSVKHTGDMASGWNARDAAEKIRTHAMGSDGKPVTFVTKLGKL